MSEEFSADENLSSMKKEKSFPKTITNKKTIDLEFSDKEIAEILKDNPGAIVLEPGRYIAIDRGEGSDYNTFDDDRFPEYKVFVYSNREPLLSVDSSDEDLTEFAQKNNLEVDQLRFTRDTTRIDDESKTFPLTKAFIPGYSEHGYSHDLSFLDFDKVKEVYPGILNPDGSMKFNLYSPTFEITHRCPIVNLGANDFNNEELFEMREELDMKRGDMNAPIPSIFSIGDPSKDKGSFILFNENKML